MNIVTYHWSRAPGKFINKRTGQEVYLGGGNYNIPGGPTFSGTIREWYETLFMTIEDVAQECATTQAPNKLFVGLDVLNILEHMVEYKVEGVAEKQKLATSSHLTGMLGKYYEVYRDETLSDTIELWHDNDLVGTVKVHDL